MRMVSSLGMSVIEIILAFAIISFALGGGVILVFTCQTSLNQEDILIEAISKAENTMHILRLNAYDDFDSIIASSSSNGQFDETISIFEISNSLKQITVQESWDGNLNYHKGSFALNGYISDRRTDGIQNTCTIFASSSQPVTTTFLNIDDGNVGTSVVARNKTVYLSANASTSSMPDLYVIDTSSTTPKILSFLDTGPGISEITLSGNYVYAANESLKGQLQIIDVSNPSIPYLVSSYKLPGTYSSSGAVGLSIFYYKGYVYLGTKKSDTQELWKIDVSDPVHPFAVTSFEVNTSVNSIFAREGKVYLGTPINNDELMVLDYSSGTLSVMGGFDAPGTVGNGKSIYQVGTTTYLGRTVDNGEFYILDTSSSSKISSLGFATLKTSIESIFVSSGLALLATNATGKEFQEWNVNDPHNPMFQNSIDLGIKPTGISCDNNAVFVSLDDSRALAIINFTQ